MLSTQCFGQIKENICSVFGSKFVTSLMPVKVALNLETEQLPSENGNDDIGDRTPGALVLQSQPCSAPDAPTPLTSPMTVSGYVSKAGLGVGRNAVRVGTPAPDQWCGARALIGQFSVPQTVLPNKL